MISLRAAMAFTAASLWAQIAYAQAVLQNGPVLSGGGHAPMYVPGPIGSQPAGSPARVQDSGPAGGYKLGQGLSELLQVNRAPGTGPNGAHFCMYDQMNPTTASHYLCFDPNAGNAGLIEAGTVGSAPAQPVNCLINGVLVSNCLSITPTVSLSGLFTVANNAALTALVPVASNTPLFRAGFTTPGDGGGAIYNYSAIPCSINSGNGDNGAQVKATDGNCWVADFSVVQANVMQWGAKGDDITDNSFIVNTAASSLCALNAGVLLFPVGTFKLHDVAAKCSGIRLVGAGQGGIDGASNNATTIDCTGMTSYCIDLGPTTAVNTRIQGTSIEQMRFINVSGPAPAVYIRQTFNAYAQNLWFATTTSNAIKVYGAENTRLDNINIQSLSGTGIEYTGDLSAPPGCALGACATRSDVLFMTHINALQGPSNSGLLVYIHDQAFDTMGDQLTFEGGVGGIKIRCTAGQPNVSYCPQQIRFSRFENEFGLLPVDAQDFTQFKCDGCFFSGPPGGGTGVNDLSFTMVNYTQGSGAGGGVQLTNTSINGANDSCVFVGVTDLVMVGNSVFGCGLAAGNWGAVQLHAGTQATLSGNQFCTSLGTGAPIGNSFGIVVDSGYNRVVDTGNTFFGCAFANLLNNSATAFSVYESNPNPPPPVGTVTEADGHLGTTGTIVFSGGNSLGGTLVITPGGTGISSSGQFTITLPANVTMNPGMLCTVNLATNWGNNSTLFPVTTTNTSSTFFWQSTVNGVSTNLTSGTAYNISYRCNGY